MGRCVPGLAAPPWAGTAAGTPAVTASRRHVALVPGDAMAACTHVRVGGARARRRGGSPSSQWPVSGRPPSPPFPAASCWGGVAGGRRGAAPLRRRRGGRLPFWVGTAAPAAAALVGQRRGGARRLRAGDRRGVRCRTRRVVCGPFLSFFSSRRRVVGAACRGWARRRGWVSRGGRPPPSSRCVTCRASLTMVSLRHPSYVRVGDGGGGGGVGARGGAWLVDVPRAAGPPVGAPWPPSCRIAGWSPPPPEAVPC